MRHSEHEGLGKSYESGKYGKNYWAGGAHSRIAVPDVVELACSRAAS